MEVQVLTVGPVQENSYLLRSGPDSKSALLIDPGDEAPRILEAIEALGVELEAHIAAGWWNSTLFRN